MSEDILAEVSEFARYDCSYFEEARYLERGQRYIDVMQRSRIHNPAITYPYTQMPIYQQRRNNHISGNDDGVVYSVLR